LVSLMKSEMDHLLQAELHALLLFPSLAPLLWRPLLLSLRSQFDQDSLDSPILQHLPRWKLCDKAPPICSYPLQEQQPLLLDQPEPHHSYIDLVIEPCERRSRTTSLLQRQVRYIRPGYDLRRSPVGLASPSIIHNKRCLS